MNQCTAADMPQPGRRLQDLQRLEPRRHRVAQLRPRTPTTRSATAAPASAWTSPAGAPTEGASVVQWDYNGGTNQLWKITQVSPGKYKFMNKKSGKVMDIYGGSANNGAPLVQWNWNGGANQQWAFTPTGDGYYKFGPASATGSALEIPNGTDNPGRKGAAVELLQR